MHYYWYLLTTLMVPVVYRPMTDLQFSLLCRQGAGNFEHSVDAVDGEWVGHFIEVQGIGSS